MESVSLSGTRHTTTTRPSSAHARSVTGSFLFGGVSDLALTRALISAVGNVLVVSTVDHPEDVLRRHLGETDKLKVVVPVVRQGVLDWLANDQKAFTHAEHVAEDVAAHLPGETVEAKAGEADVDLAIRDALQPFLLTRSLSRSDRRIRKERSSRPLRPMRPLGVFTVSLFATW